MRRRQGWILIVCTIFMVAAIALWWRAHSAATAQAAFAKTVQDAGFAVGETRLVMIPFDLPIDFPIVEDLFTRAVADFTVERDEDSRRLRGLVKECPYGTIIQLGSALSQEEQSALMKQYPDAAFAATASLVGPAFNPIRPFGTVAPAPNPAPTHQAAESLSPVE